MVHYTDCADRPVMYQRFDALAWRDARDHCASYGAHLVTIGSAEENAFVHTNFASLTPEIWIGASDEDVEGDWQWVTGEDWVYTNWAPDEPNDYLTGEDYAIMSWLHGKWADYRGYVDGAPVDWWPFVCEWE